MIDPSKLVRTPSVSSSSLVSRVNLGASFQSKLNAGGESAAPTAPSGQQVIARTVQETRTAEEAATPAPGSDAEAEEACRKLLTTFVATNMQMAFDAINNMEKLERD